MTIYRRPGSGGIPVTGAFQPRQWQTPAAQYTTRRRSEMKKGELITTVAEKLNITR